MRKIRPLFLAIIATLTFGLGAAAQATDNPQMDAEVLRINNEWARIRYLVANENQQLAQLQTLATQAAAVVRRYPNRAEPLLWQGIVTSEEAARASTFHQLGYATTARNILQRARAIDANAAHGGVTMSLGVLYYKVPGFPIAFGSASRARTLLLAALAQDPNGLDANFFYADFLESRANMQRHACISTGRCMHRWIAAARFGIMAAAPNAARCWHALPAANAPAQPPY